MKFKIVYIVSALFVASLWFYHFNKKHTKHPIKIVQVDSMAAMPKPELPTVKSFKKKSITVLPNMKTVAQQPTIIYVDDDKDSGILGISNEVVTLIIGLGNIVVLIFHKKKSNT